MTRLVSDENVHKGTSKLHKMDLKNHFAVHITPSLFDFVFFLDLVPITE